MEDKETDKIDEHSIALYSLLVDQVHRYISIFWQFPLALIAANFFGIEKFSTSPLILVLMSFIDAVLLYAFYISVSFSSDIIEAARKAEERIRAVHPWISQTSRCGRQIQG